MQHRPGLCAIVALITLIGAVQRAFAGTPADASHPIDIKAVVVNLIAEAEVPAQEAGSLVEVVASEGARVKAGATLARIDDRDAKLEVSRANIALQHATEQAANDVKLRLARQSLRLANLELEKAEEANKELSRVYSPSQIEKLKIEVEKAQLEVEQAEKDLAAAARAVKAAENELQIARRAVDRRVIVAPIDGVVVEVRRQIGEWLQPGETVIRLVRDDRLRAEGFLHLRDLSKDFVGEPVELRVDLPEVGETAFEGIVSFVSPEANPINGQLRVWAEFENGEGKLRPGMSATMTIRPRIPRTRADGDAAIEPQTSTPGP